MQSIHNLFINNLKVKLISHDVTRELSAIGRAFFIIKSDNIPQIGQIVIYDMGFEAKPLVRFFVGMVQSITPQGKGVFAFKAKELVNVLLLQASLVLRHVTLETVMLTLGQKIGLKFVHSNAAYWSKELPFFYSTGTGRDALNMVAAAFGISNFCWQQQADGTVFVGKHSELPTSSNKMNIDYSVFNSMKTDGAWSTSMVPGLMPGVVINEKIINSINITENKMLLKCITH